MWLRQSTASQEILLGPFVDSTDGNTAETGLTIANTDIKIWKEGGTTESNKNSGGATHIAAGRYYAVLDATDTNTLGKMEVSVHVAGALPVRRGYMVLPAVVYDSLVLGTDFLQVDIEQVDGDGTAAANLNSACDNYSATRGLSGTALPAAAADAAGGIPISDAGGLDMDAILADTNELQADWANGGRLDLIVDAILDDTDLIDDGTSGLAKIATDVAAILVDTGTTIPGTITTMQGNVTDILADTNELQGDWTDGGRLDLIVDAIVDDTDLIDDGTSGLAKIATDVAAVLVDTGTTIPGTITTMQGNVTDILADTNELQTDLTDGGRLDLLIDGILEDTGTTLDTLIDRMAVIVMGEVSDAGTALETFTYGGVTASVTVDEDGNRSIAWS